MRRARAARRQSLEPASRRDDRPDPLLGGVRRDRRAGRSTARTARRLGLGRNRTVASASARLDGAGSTYAFLARRSAGPQGAGRAPAAPGRRSRPGWSTVPATPVSVEKTGRARRRLNPGLRQVLQSRGRCDWIAAGSSSRERAGPTIRGDVGVVFSKTSERGQRCNISARARAECIVLACAATLLALPAAATAPSRRRRDPGPHLPPVQQNLELVGELEPAAAQGAIVDGQIADLAVHEGYAYLNSWDEPSCTKGGTYIVDIRDPASPQEIGFLAGRGRLLPRRGRPRRLARHAAVHRRPARGQRRGLLERRHPPAGRAGHRRRLRPLRRHRSGEPGARWSQNAGDQLARGLAGPGSPVSSPTPTTASSSGRTARRPSSSASTTPSSPTSTSTTSPTRPIPELIADLDLVDLFPGIVGPSANGNAIFHHDMVVKRIGGQMRMLVSYWDARLRPARRHQPGEPDADHRHGLPRVDPLTGFEPPGGQRPRGRVLARQRVLPRRRRGLRPVPADQRDHRAPRSKASSSPSRSRRAEPIEPGARSRGDTVFVGDGLHRYGRGATGRGDDRGRRTRRLRRRLPGEDRRDRGRRLRDGGDLQQQLRRRRRPLRGADQHARRSGHRRHPG